MRAHLAAAGGRVKLLVLLRSPLLLERHFFVPFSGRRKIALVLPEELAPVLPGSLDDYAYGFTVPPATRHPVSVFLLPVATRRLVTGALRDFAPRLGVLDIARARLPQLRGRPAALLVDPARGRLAFHVRGRFVAGRGGRAAAEDEAALEREKKIFLHAVRAGDNVFVHALPDGADEAAACLYAARPFPFRAPAASAVSPRDVLAWGALAAALLVLVLAVSAARRERFAARDGLATITAELARARAAAEIADEQALALLNAPAVSRLMDDRFSPLSSFRRFSEAVPAELPLMLEYLEIDRGRMTMNARLRSPEQVDRLVGALVTGDRFREPSLGELRVEADHVRFPLTLRLSATAGEDG